MLQYLVILLDDTSTAYCHADNPLQERRLMPIETLRKAVLFGMKENLMIQYVYPGYALPEAYTEVIESIDHVKIVPAEAVAACADFDEENDVAVCRSMPERPVAQNMVLRLPLAEVIARKYDIALLLPQVKRLNLCITDVERLTDESLEHYRAALGEWAKCSPRNTPRSGSRNSTC